MNFIQILCCKGESISPRRDWHIAIVSCCFQAGVKNKPRQGSKPCRGWHDSDNVEKAGMAASIPDTSQYYSTNSLIQKMFPSFARIYKTGVANSRFAKLYFRDTCFRAH